MKINPFYIMPIALLVSMCLYHLGLSDLYYQSDFLVLDIIILIVCVCSLSVGYLLGPMLKLSSKDISTNTNPLFLFIIFGGVVEFLAYGGIPLVDVVLGKNFAYKEFGIKSFHVFYLSYLAAFSVINFERYTRYNDKRFLFQSFACFLFPILIVNRGCVVMMLFPIFILWLVKVKCNMKVIVRMIVILFILILSFGYIGDSRMKGSGYENDNAIFSVGQSNEIFYNLPSGFFWTYLYLSSPYANLSNQEITKNYDKGDFFDFLSVSIVPDFLSKYSENPFQKNRITDELTVGTAFYYPFISYGYLGIVILFLYFCVFILFFLFFNRNRYFNSILAILSSLSFFLMFSNMLIFSLFFLQLIIITIFSRLKIGNTRLI